MKNHILTLILGFTLGVLAFKPIQSYFTDKPTYDTIGMANLAASLQPIQFIDEDRYGK